MVINEENGYLRHDLIRTLATCGCKRFRAEVRVDVTSAAYATPLIVYEWIRQLACLTTVGASMRDRRSPAGFSRDGRIGLKQGLSGWRISNSGGARERP